MIQLLPYHNLGVMKYLRISDKPVAEATPPSEEYMQKIASYINNKINEYGKIDSFRRQPLDRQSVLLQLNIADDYFKAKKQISILEEELQGKEKELYDLKHELISAQIKLENAEKQGKELQKQLNEDAKKIVRLETELKDK